MYAHVVTDPAFPGKLALQYWLFYVFNDWNNLHEGDWEMIQLNFDASTPAQAMRQAPVDIGYSQHEGAERAAWTDDKLERIDGTHPVVHPADGSHANFYGGPTPEPPPRASAVTTRGPTLTYGLCEDDSERRGLAGRRSHPSFEGRWGAAAGAFFNGPTGPNLKLSGRADPLVGTGARGPPVPAAGAFGARATSVFCAAVGAPGRRAVVYHPLESGCSAGSRSFSSSCSRAPPGIRRLHFAWQRRAGAGPDVCDPMYRERIPLWVGIGRCRCVSLRRAPPLIVLHARASLGVNRR